MWSAAAAVVTGIAMHCILFENRLRFKSKLTGRRHGFGSGGLTPTFWPVGDKIWLSQPNSYVCRVDISVKA